MERVIEFVTHGAILSLYFENFLVMTGKCFSNADDNNALKLACASFTFCLEVTGAQVSLLSSALKSWTACSENYDMIQT